MSKEMLEPHTYCRCCLSNEGLKSLSETSEENEKMYVDSIKDCFSIELSAEYNLSNMICQICAERLKEAYAFKLQIKTIQEVLYRKRDEYTRSLTVEIKKEENDYEIMENSIEYLEDDFDYLSESERTESAPKSSTVKRKQQKNPAKKVPTKRGTVRTCSRRNLPYKLDANDLTCPVCKETFPLLRTLTIHMNVHYPNYLCNICGRGFVTKERLDRHSISHDVGKYPCKVCNKTFRNKNILGVHSKVHKSNMPFRCPECKDRFINYYMRQKHLINVHGMDRRLYKCKLCPMSFILSGKLLKHTRSVHLQERDYICQECGKAFYTNICLVRHMVKHTGARDFKCSVCGNEYGRKSTLREHMRIHNNDKRFSCTLCGKAFTQKCTLKSHMRMHEKKAA